MKPNFIREAVENPERLQALLDTGLLDSAPEPYFDRLSRLAGKLLNVPIAILSLVDHHRQFFKSFVGLPTEAAQCRETPLSHSFCKHVVASRSPLIIRDAREDPFLQDNPAIESLGVISYLGMPLLSGAGFVIGSLCVIDTIPRDWTDENLEDLQDLTATVMSEFAHRAENSLRRKTEIALRNVDKSLRIALESSQIADWKLTVETGKFTGSASLLPLLGLAENRKPSTLQEWLEHVDPEQARGLHQVLLGLIAKKSSRPDQADRSLGQESIFDRELQIHHAGGTSRWIKITGKLSRDPLGRPESINGLCRDVTEERAVRDQLAVRIRMDSTLREQEASPVDDRSGEDMPNPADDPVFDELVKEYQRSIRGQVESLREAIRDNDLQSAKRVAHQTKGVSAMYGYPKIGKAAERIDVFIREGGRSHELAPLCESFARVVEEVLSSENSDSRVVLHSAPR